MISCAGGRVFQSANSNWITPIVSSVISLDAARLLADAGIDGLQSPACASTRFSTSRDQPVLLVERELPRPCTITWP